MNKIRIIPVVLFKNGMIVQSKKFEMHQRVGIPAPILDRLCSWNVDEVIFLNISNNQKLDFSRDDLNFKNIDNFQNIIKHISKHAFMPLTVGGGIKSINQINEYFKYGADKICINSEAVSNPNLIKKASEKYGSQSIVISIDVKKIKNNYIVFSENGKTNTNIEISEHIKNINNIGAGEILVNSIDRDGAGKGYDKILLNKILSLTKLPVIIMGGAGKFEHFYQIIKKSNVKAVAAANIFLYSENSYHKLNKYLYSKKMNVRTPIISCLKNKKSTL